jgi:tight adherence protein B
MNAIIVPVCIVGGSSAAGAAAGILVYRVILRWQRHRVLSSPAPLRPPRIPFSLRSMLKGAYDELSRDRRSRRSKKITLLIAAGAFLAGGVLTGKIIFALICAAGAAAGTHAYFVRRAKRNREQINTQLGEALGMIANSVRAGQSLHQALELLSREAPQPLSMEFSQVISELRFGTPLYETLQGLVKRVPTADMTMAVNAMHLAKETGGNLAEILTRVASTIAERRKIQGKVNTLTAQGRASGMIMSMVPFILLAVLYGMEPSMVGLLFTTFLGNLMLLAVIAMISAGAFIIDRIVNVSV